MHYLGSDGLLCEKPHFLWSCSAPIAKEAVHGNKSITRRLVLLDHEFSPSSFAPRSAATGDPPLQPSEPCIALPNWRRTPSARVNRDVLRGGDTQTIILFWPFGTSAF
ncbi:hypothetical protein EVAR_52153_1 [Eumeta japonica]|uniref:Uncharacterized protein n=1 Tax=Eumeta variegata TaxID=151549 RepID=A0A4C1Y9K2_EUMVA|nr:hypothetical protein EVAR_52153_1 [Eumeta japonica]